MDDEVDLWALHTGSGQGSSLPQPLKFPLLCSQHEWEKDLIEPSAEISNVVQDLIESTKNFIPRHFKTIQESGYHTSVFYLGTFVIFIFILFLNHCASVATMRGLGSSSLFITSHSRKY